MSALVCPCPCVEGRGRAAGGFAGAPYALQRERDGAAAFGPGGERDGAAAFGPGGAAAVREEAEAASGLLRAADELSRWGGALRHTGGGALSGSPHTAMDKSANRNVGI